MRAAALSLAFSLTGPAAEAIECRLALLLALDISSSVDEEEDALQRGGLASALLAPEVAAAFFANDQPVALAVYEWSGRYNQEVLLDWTLIDSPERLVTVSNTLASSTRSHNDFPTAMGLALSYGAQMFERAPACAQQTLDMAGDGENNEGMRPAQAYALETFAAITVNGLVVHHGDLEGKNALISYYNSQVIRGPGAFLEIANGFEDYERAMRRKLERELSSPVIGSLASLDDAS